MLLVSQAAGVSSALRPAPDPVLLCAATRWEAAPLARRWNLKAAGSNRFEGSLGDRGLVMLKTGIGPAAASYCLRRLESASFRCALSVGFAGALQPGMASGDLVADLQGVELETVSAAREIAHRQNTPIHFGKIVHTERALATPAQKAAAGARSRAGAADMETSAVRAWGQKTGVTVLAVRVILDAIEDSLPEEVPAGEGFADLAGYALRHWRELPKMAALGLKQRRAIGALGRFLDEFLAVL